MPKWVWVFIGSVLLFSLQLSILDYKFMQGNVWTTHEQLTADVLTNKVDFLQLSVTHYVSRTLGAVMLSLLIITVYLALWIHKLEKRIGELESNPGTGKLD